MKTLYKYKTLKMTDLINFTNAVLIILNLLAVRTINFNNTG